jgi:DNA mismatch repair protein MSH3
LEERVNAVQEILNTQSHSLDKLGVIIKNLPDLVKGLARIQYGKVCAFTSCFWDLSASDLTSSGYQTSPKELATILEAYQKIGRTFELFGSVQDVKFSSPLLREIAFALPRVHAPIEALLSIIDVRKASLEEKENLWRDDGKFPNISAAQRVRPSCISQPLIHA